MPRVPIFSFDKGRAAAYLAPQGRYCVVGSGLTENECQFVTTRLLGKLGMQTRGFTAGSWSGKPGGCSVKHGSRPGKMYFNSQNQGMPRNSEYSLVCSVEASGSYSYTYSYLRGEYSTDTCLPGSSGLSDKGECAVAAIQLGLSFSRWSDANRDDRPSGCVATRSGSVYFNGHSGGRAYSNARPICKQVPRWVLAGPSMSCDEGCAAVGRECSVAPAHLRNSEIDSDEEMNIVLRGLGSECLGFAHQFGSNTDVPLQSQSGTCYVSASTRSEESWSCSRASHNKRRLCTCIPQEVCRDVEWWSDSRGYDCDWYSYGSRCATDGNVNERAGLTASAACCACSGGDH